MADGEATNRDGGGWRRGTGTEEIGETEWEQRVTLRNAAGGKHK